MKVGDIIKMNERTSFNRSWFDDDIYIIKKVIKNNSDGNSLVKLNKKHKLISTWYLRLLTLKEIRKLKLQKISQFYEGGHDEDRLL